MSLMAVQITLELCLLWIFYYTLCIISQELNIPQGVNNTELNISLSAQNISGTFVGAQGKMFHSFCLFDLRVISP